MYNHWAVITAFHIILACPNHFYKFAARFGYVHSFRNKIGGYGSPTPETAAKAQAAMEAAMPAMRAAILQYVEEMEQARGDSARLFAAAHEIRGFAETAGMITTGRIAEVLCRYMDDLQRLGEPTDATIVALHVAAISRAARAEDDSVRTGQAVAAELAALVARRLSEVEQD
jgi:hypothetical protein